MAPQLATVPHGRMAHHQRPRCQSVPMPAPSSMPRGSSSSSTTRPLQEHLCGFLRMGRQDDRGQLRHAQNRQLGTDLRRANYGWQGFEKESEMRNHTAVTKVHNGGRNAQGCRSAQESRGQVVRVYGCTIASSFLAALAPWQPGPCVAPHNPLAPTLWNSAQINTSST